MTFAWLCGAFFYGCSRLANVSNSCNKVNEIFITEQPIVLSVGENIVANICSSSTLESTLYFNVETKQHKEPFSGRRSYWPEN